MYLWRKFVAEYDMNGAINNREDTPINFPLIRYADVLLMLAECYNQTDQQTKAVDLINQVRARVDMPGLNSGPSYLQATTKEQVFERIRHERAVELAGEETLGITGNFGRRSQRLYRTILLQPCRSVSGLFMADSE